MVFLTDHTEKGKAASPKVVCGRTAHRLWFPVPTVTPKSWPCQPHANLMMLLDLVVSPKTHSE